MALYVRAAKSTAAISNNSRNRRSLLQTVLWTNTLVLTVSLAITGGSAAANLRGIEDVLANLPSNISNGFVCSAKGELYVAPYESCITPIGVGHIAGQWSNGRYTYAMVNDINGDTLCLVGRVSGLSGHMKIAPLPENASSAVILACMRKFNQLAPVPALAFAVWY